MRDAIAKMTPPIARSPSGSTRSSRAAAPSLAPKTWYGMPAYANEDGKVVCFFRDAGKFKERYAMLGFNDSAKLDQGSMWPIAFALTKLTAADETKIRSLVKKAVALMNETTVTTPNELEIRVERVFDAPRAHVFSVWTDPTLIPEWWGDGTVVEEMDVRAGGTYRFRTAFGVVEGEFREVDAPERLVQTFQNHLQTLEFEDLGDRTKLTQTMRFATTEERDTTMQYGVEEGAKGGFARVDAVLQRLALDA